MNNEEITPALSSVRPAQERAWREWLAKQPAHVRAVAERFPPWCRVRIKSSGQFACIYSYGEPKGDETNVTVTVNVPSAWNPGRLTSIMFAEYDGHAVFGLKPDDIEVVLEVED